MKPLQNHIGKGCKRKYSFFLIPQVLPIHTLHEISPTQANGASDNFLEVL